MGEPPDKAGELKDDCIENRHDDACVIHEKPS